MKTDTVTKDFISYADIFADVFNYYVYGGRQVISPEQLKERDSVELALPYGADGAAVPVQRYRDVEKLYTARTDGKVEYVLFGVENQAEIHYAMPVKNNLYDALKYAGQVEAAARSHRKALKSGKGRKPDAGEFLGGFWKEDRLIPSVTLTIYFGCEDWDGPLSLLDMMEAPDQEILSCMDNYHVNLIAPALMPDDEIMKFRTDLREVMFFIKYSKDKEKLDEILKIHKDRFQSVERRAVDVMEAVTNTGLKYDEREGKINVCQAIEEMRIESEQIGEKRGRRIGEERGRRIGEERGALKTAQKNARSFYNMGLDVKMIAEGIGYDVATVKEWLGLEE